MSNLFEVYTDGSSLGNPGPGGFGVVVISKGKIVKEIGGFDKNTTNNRMELLGAIEALKYLNNLKDISKTVIYVDSAYVLGGVTLWINNWEKNGWKTANKKDVLNKDLWLELISLNRKFSDKIIWQKVKGHSTNIYNNRADFIATNCASSLSNNF